LQVHFRKIRYIHTTITTRSFFQRRCSVWTSYPNLYECLCATLLRSLCNRFVRLYFKLNAFQISVWCRTVTQLLPHINTRKLQYLFCDFQNCNRPTYLYLIGILVFNRTLCYPQFSHNQVPSPSAPTGSNYPP